MKGMLRDIWRYDRRAFLKIVLLNVAVSLTGGISIVMLVPMLGLMEISPDATSAMQMLTPFLQKFPDGVRMTLVIGCYFLLVAFKSGLNTLLNIRESSFLEGYSYALREKLYKTVSGARWEQLAKSNQAETIALFTAQCTQASHGTAELIRLISSVFSALVSIGIALWLSVPMSLFVLLCGGAFAFVYRRLMRVSRAYGDEMIRMNRSMYQELLGQLRGMKEVRAYGVQREHELLFDNISAALRDSQLKYVRKQALPGMLYSITAAGMISVIFLVSELLFAMDTARLIVLIYAFVRLWPVFGGFFGRLNGIMTAVPAHEKLTKAFEETEMEAAVQEGGALGFEREVEFRHVSFAYQGSEEDVLKDVSFCLKKGSITALIGRSGAGKTTIADLMLGFLEPTGGEILIDGVLLTRERLHAWRQAIGYIPQEPLILNASVRENLARFHPEATQEEMIEALKKAQAWPLVEGLADGLETKLGDEGVRLSGGERQRIVLARVLLGRPRLIVMDEATSAMDYESELAVQKAFRAMEGQVTMLIIAHRLATVHTAKSAIVLEDGRITEQGTLQELGEAEDGYLSRLLRAE